MVVLFFNGRATFCPAAAYYVMLLFIRKTPTAVGLQLFFPERGGRLPLSAYYDFLVHY
jgi:hypothetical protein